MTASNVPSDERRVKEKDVVPTQRGRFIESVKIGAKLGPDGRVDDELFVIPEGVPVYFTMNIRESPVGLTTRAVWFDDNNKELAQEQRPMNGAKSATFALKKKLPRGFYHVDGYWGGNFAAEKTFEVIKR